MANAPHFKLTTRNTMLNQINTSIGSSGLFIIWAGNQPADVSSATTGANVTVAALSWVTTGSAFAAATGGQMTANSITSDTSAIGGSAKWFSLCNASGTRVADGSVDTSGADLNLNATNITTGATVAISAFTITMTA